MPYFKVPDWDLLFSPWLAWDYVFSGSKMSETASFTVGSCPWPWIRHDCALPLYRGIDAQFLENPAIVIRLDEVLVETTS